MDKIFLSVLHMSETATLVILAVLIVRFLLRKAPKIFAYVLWSVVFFRLVCPFTIESAFGLVPGNLQTSVETETLSDQTTPTDQTALTGNTAYNSVSSAQSGSLLREDPMNPNSMSTRQLMLWGAEIIWLVGIAVMLFFSAFSYFRWKKNLADAVHVEENIYAVDKLQTPFVLGVFRPRIYLQADLAGEERAYILAHEKMHIHRLDHVVKLIGFGVLLLHWMNPFVWLAFLLMSKDMEMSCDEAVIRQMGMEIKKEYSTSLLNMAMGKNRIVGTPLAFGEGNVNGRIQNVLHYKKVGVGIIVLCLFVVIIVIALFATNRLERNRIKLSRGRELPATVSTEVLQEYDLQPEAKSYMVFLTTLEEGREGTRQLIASGDFTKDTRKGEMNLQMQFNGNQLQEEAEDASVSISCSMGPESQFASFSVENYTMRAGNILWEDEAYHDISLEKPYLLAVEYLGGENDLVAGAKEDTETVSGIEAFDCESLMGEDLVGEDGSIWSAAEKQSKEKNITTLLVYYMVSEKTSEELTADLDQLQIKPAEQTEYELSSQTQYPSNLEQMYAWRTEYAGDNSAVGNITDAWFMSDKNALEKDGFELQTSLEPYGITVRYPMEAENVENAYGDNAHYLELDAALLFSLIHNAGTVYIEMNGEEVAAFGREALEVKYGNLWEASESYDSFCKLYDYILYRQGLEAEQENEASPEELEVSLNDVMNRIFTDIGFENAFPYNNTVDLKEGDALIKLCTSSDGKYEAYGCISAEYGYQGIFLNDIIDGEDNVNYLEDSWAYGIGNEPPTLEVPEEYEVIFTFFQKQEEEVVQREYYFDTYDTGTMYLRNAVDEVNSWAMAFCGRDGESIVSMASENAVEELEENGLLLQAGGTVSFGVSSPWPMAEDNFVVTEVTEDSAEILYYALVSDPHVSVWHETLEFSSTEGEFVVTSEAIEYLDGIDSLGQFELAYETTDFPGSNMDYYANGLGKALNDNAIENTDSAFYQELFQPDTAAVYLLNLKKDTQKVQTRYGYLDDGTEDVFVEITFADTKESVTVIMTQPYGLEGIWVVKEIRK